MNSLALRLSQPVLGHSSLDERWSISRWDPFDWKGSPAEGLPRGRGR